MQERCMYERRKGKEGIIKGKKEKIWTRNKKKTERIRN